MSIARPSRPTLKITRYQDEGAAARFAFDVWSPFAGRYQAVTCLEDGLRRIDELAALVGQMFARRHPKRSVLTDAPDLEEGDEGLWAELRVNAAGHVSYDTRLSGRRVWMRSFGGKDEVIETICNSVGYPGRAAL